MHVKHTDGTFEYKPYFCLPANELNDVIAPSCYSCFDYPNALADMVVSACICSGACMAACVSIAHSTVHAAALVQTLCDQFKSYHSPPHSLCVLTGCRLATWACLTWVVT